MALAVLGVALFLNVLSLRAIAESTRLPPLIWVVFDVRDDVSHRYAQALELFVGCIGLAMAALGVWWNRVRRRVTMPQRSGPPSIPTNVVRD